jgi:hypothetical protein
VPSFWWSPEQEQHLGSSKTTHTSADEAALE